MIPVLAVLAAVSAVLLVVSGPAGALARLGVHRDPLARPSAERGPFPAVTKPLRIALRSAMSVLQPRADAMPARTRAFLAAMAGLGAMLPSGSWPWWLQSLLMATVAAAVFFGFALFEPSSVARRRAQIVLDLPQALDLLESCLVAGLPLRRASVVVAAALPGPLGAELASVSRRAGLGLSERQAWMAMGEQPVLRTVAVDIARAAGTGASLHRALRVHAEDARRRRRAHLESNAKTVGVRSVLPLMTCFLPAFVLVGIVPIIGGMVKALNFF